MAEVVGPRDGEIRSTDTDEVSAINDGSGALRRRDRASRAGQRAPADGYAVHLVAEAYKHSKPVAAGDEGMQLLQRAGVPRPATARPTRW